MDVLNLADLLLSSDEKNELDAECFCVAFLCVHGYGIQIRGYEDDLTPALTEFFHVQGMEYRKISEIVCKGKIYTDCSDYDNFKKSMTAINQKLDTYGVRLVVLEDFVYCERMILQTGDYSRRIHQNHSHMFSHRCRPGSGGAVPLRKQYF